MNDREFVDGLRRQDAAAVRHLSECLLPSVWRFVYYRVRGDRHLAEDVVSESVLALIRAVALPEFDVVSPTAWLRSVASHKIHDHFRAVARVQHLIDQAASVVDQGKDSQPSCQEEINERRASVRKVMDDLPEPHRLALEWKYIDHLSVREIAERMATTEKAVEAILYRARREFRSGLGVIDRDEVPFRMNGSHSRGGTSHDGNLERDQIDGGDTRVNGNGKQQNDGRPPVSGRTGGGSSTEVEARQPAGFDELKQQQL